MAKKIFCDFCNKELKDSCILLERSDWSIKEGERHEGKTTDSLEICRECDSKIDSFLTKVEEEFKHIKK